MSAAEQALMEKWRRGEPITALDHIPTIETAEELAGFRAGLIRANRMTDELLTAIYRHEIKIGASHSR